MNNENEQLKKEIQTLRAELAQLRQDFILHSHNGLDSLNVITGATIQTATGGKRLRMQGNPTNQYQFLNGDTKVGHLKIDDDGAGGFFAEINIDFLGLSPVLQVGTVLGAAESTFFSTVGFSATQRAAVGDTTLTGGPSSDQTFSLTHSGGADATLQTNVKEFAFTGTGANGGVLKNLKNAAASALSGTQKDIEIDIGGVPYYFTVYPTKA